MPSVYPPHRAVMKAEAQLASAQAAMRSAPIGSPERAKAHDKVVAASRALARARTNETYALIHGHRGGTA